jgi:phosphoribosylaminoimidazole-succinocarboxamide synthase
MVEGKTKIITSLWGGAEVGIVTNKSDITAGDGAKHDIIAGKAELATRTTCNVFDYLAGYDMPVAYVGRGGPTTFLTKICDMTPVEVVVRGEAAGSYCKRNPDVPPGQVFEKPLVEFYLKTRGREFNGQQLPCDDPLMVPVFDNDGVIEWALYDPSLPDMKGRIGPVESWGEENSSQVKQDLDQCQELALIAFSHLQVAWSVVDGRLIDIKFEFGKLPDGTVVLSDVVDCDSWRVMWNGLQLSKQGYRDGDDLEKVLGVYRIAAALTDRFPIFSVL